MPGLSAWRRQRPPLATRLAQNSFLALAVRVCTTALSLATVPWLLDALGVEGFGLYSVIISVSGFLAFVDGGLAVGVRSRVAASIARGDPDSAREAVAAGLALLLVVAASLLGLFAMSLALIPWSTLLGSTSNAQGKQAVLALTAYLVLYAASVPLLVGQRALEGLERTRTVTLLTVLPGVLTFGAAYVLKDRTDNLSAFTAIAGAGPLAVNLVATWFLRRSVLPWPRLIVHTRYRAVRELWSLGWPMIIVSVALSLSYTLDPFVIAAHLGPQAAAEYALANRLSQVTNLVLVSTVPILWAHYAKQRALGEVSSSGVMRTSALYGLIAAVLGAFLVTFGPAATDVWSDGQVLAGRDLLCAMAVWGVILALQLPAAMHQTDLRSLRFQAMTTSIMAGVNVLLSLVLVRKVGVAGPVWASACALAVCHATPLLVRTARHRERPVAATM